MGVPSFAVRRYFLSQISRDASWNGTASMSFGSSFMTVFMNPWHSKYCAADNGSRDSAGKKKTAQPTDRPAVAKKAAVRQPVPPKTYPPSADLDRMKQHKILCRGRKTNDVS